MNIISKAAQEEIIPVDVLCSALHISRATYYRYLDAKKIGVQGELSPKTPVNALNSDEKQEILNLLHSENFICQSASKIDPPSASKTDPPPPLNMTAICSVNYGF